MENIVKIAGIWETGWNVPLSESILWSYPLRDYKVDEWIMTPVSGIAETSVKEYTDIPAVIEANPELTVVYLDEKAPTTLTEFVHPAKALYVFGKATLSPYIAYGRPQDLAVRVETPANLGLHWPHQIACVILYDRFKKMGS